MINFIAKQCQARMLEVGPDNFAEAKENDFLGTILRMHGQDPSKIAEKDLVGYSLTNIGAGSDTTSVSLTSIMYCLLKSPERMQRVSARRLL